MSAAVASVAVAPADDVRISVSLTEKEIIALGALMLSLAAAPRVHRVDAVARGAVDRMMRVAAAQRNLQSALEVKRARCRCTLYGRQLIQCSACACVQLAQQRLRDVSADGSSRRFV